MRYNIGFLSGFMDGDCAMPMRADGFKEELTFRKGAAFDGWISDDMLLHGGERVGEKNRRALHELLDAWLDGLEYEG